MAEPNPWLGATKRQAGLWTLVLVAVFVGSIALLSRSVPFGEHFLRWMGATLVAFGVATAQAYRNGSVALSWLTVAAPSVGLFISELVRFQHWMADPVEMLGLVVLSGFLGTTAHLLGAETARLRGTAPRQASRIEQRVLLAVLVVTGGVFAAGYVVPLY